MPIIKYDKYVKGEDRESSARMYGNDISTYKNQIIAGGIIVDFVHSLQPKNLDEFLHLMKPMLADDIHQFIEENKQWMEEMISENEHNDYDNDLFSVSTRFRTYLSKNREKRLCESIQHCHLRQAVQFFHSIKDPVKRKTLIQTVFCDLSRGFYTHATPTIFNGGKRRAQMGSCFLITTEDDRQAISDTWSHIFAISANKGGIGLDVSRLRHSAIGTEGMSQGIIPEIQVVDRVVKYADQTGLRKGGCTVYLGIWHSDVIPFIDLCLKHGDPNQRTPNLFTALWIQDLFFHRVIEGGMWSLFCPKLVLDLFNKHPNHPVKYTDENGNVFNRPGPHPMFSGKSLADVFGQEFEKMYVECETYLSSTPIPARDIYDKIIKSQLNCGRPFVMHCDHANYKSNQKNIGILRMSNLCTEIMEVTTRTDIPSCNLASINLRKLVKCSQSPPPQEIISRVFDFEELARITRQLVRNINQVIVENDDPIPEITGCNHRERPLGIGVSAFAEMLYKLDLSFECVETKILNKKIFACMYFNFLLESWRMAVETKSPHYSFRGSPLSKGIFQFDLWKTEFDHRNKYLNGVTRDVSPIDPSDWGHITTSEGISNWDQLRDFIVVDGVYNSLGIALMPTATTSQILRNTESTEAPQSNVFVRNVMNCNNTIMNRHLEKDLDEIGLWTENVRDFILAHKTSIQDLDKALPDMNIYLTDSETNRLQHIKKKYKTMWELSQKIFIDLAADRGVFVCQAQSLNLYFSGEDIEDRLKSAHIYAWRKGVKSTYYVRTDPGSEPYQALGMKTKFPEGSGRKQCEEEVCTMCSA
jgi:ribonucleoside-diphosphate reductase alpha chain